VRGTSGRLSRNSAPFKKESMNRVWLPLHHVWTTDAGMTYFLGVLVVVLFIVFPLAHLGLVERFLVDIAFSLMLISGAIATHRSHFLTALIIVLTVAGLIVHWLTMYLAAFRHPLLDAFFAIACFGSFVVVLMLQVFRPGPITLHRVLGAVAAYISIGITWGYAYYATSLVTPGAVRFDSPLQAYDIPGGRYIYFSFTTLTTVGYGDAVPVHPVTRALAVAEALIGQLYPAILIAGVLGLALQTRIHNEK
jgi:hypothetical protein